MRLIAAFFLALIFANPAMAQGAISDLFCDNSLLLEQKLEQVLKAAKIGAGMRGPDSLLEIWITPRNGDWTLVQRYANGRSCIVAIGENWENMIPAQDPA